MTIPTPSPGELVDSSYLSRIIEEINNLDKNYSTKTAQSSVRDQKTQMNNMKPTISMALDGAYASKTSDISKKGDSVSFSHTFAVTFSQPPIVTITPVLRSSGVNKDVSGISVIISSVTANKVDFRLVFDSKSGKTEVGVNILAFGMPVLS